MLEIVFLFLIALFLLFVIFVALAPRRMRGRQVSDLVKREEFDGQSWQIFYFYSASCEACGSLTPKMTEYKEKFPSVYCVDVAQDLELARRFGVAATPSAVLAKNGKIAEVLVGTGLLRRARKFIEENQNDQG